MIKMIFDYWDRFVDRWYNGTMKADMLTLNSATL